jgi:hypothetical protein
MMNGQAIQEVKKATIEVKNATMVNTQAISKLEVQMGQLANHLGDRDKGKFPSQPVTNPKAHGQEHAIGIVTLRSGRQVDNQVVEPEVNLVGQEGKESDNKEERGAEPSIVTPNVKDPPRSFISKAPYLERLKASKKNAQFAEILEVFKQVYLNIPFLDAIQQVPSYAKFLKDLVMIKRKTNVPKKAYLTEQVSSIL